MQKMMLRIKFRYAFYGKTEHSFESGIMKIKVIQRDTEVQMKEIKLKAMAKINLGLDVTRKREDGYHEVRMIMQSINMYDQIRLSPLEDNLVYKAAKLLMDEFQVTSGVEIHLRKFIPTAAGMGGGSSDAAAVLVGVNRMFQLGLTKRELMERSVAIGADVPFCVLRGTALAEGIGEILTPLPSLPKCFVLIAKPPINVSTKFVYTNLRANELTCHPDIDGQIRALQDGDLEAACKKMGNVLETVTIPAYPIIQTIKDKMMQCGAVNAMMSGSGPTVFGIFNEREQAEKAAELLREEDKIRQMFVTTAM